MYYCAVNRRSIYCRQKRERSSTQQAWLNRAEEIIKSEIGAPEYNKRLERQNALFQVASVVLNVAVWYIKTLSQQRARCNLHVPVVATCIQKRQQSN